MLTLSYRGGNVCGGAPPMHGGEKSDRLVVPAELPSKPAVVAGAEVVEGRGLPEGSAVSDDAPGSGPGLAYPWMLARARHRLALDPTLAIVRLRGPAVPWTECLSLIQTWSQKLSPRHQRGRLARSR